LESGVDVRVAIDIRCSRLRAHSSAYTVDSTNGAVSRPAWHVSRAREVAVMEFVDHESFKAVSHRIDVVDPS